MAFDNFEDILGGGPTTDVSDGDLSAGTGRNFRALDKKYLFELDRGVDVTWLAQAFTYPRRDVERRLTGCIPIRMTSAGARIYDFRDACAYMVRPKIDVLRYIEQMEPKDLPERLRSEYWSSRLKEQKARQVGGDLWLTEDVQAAFGEVFALIKDVVKLWTDTIDEESLGLDDAQRDQLDTLCADLLTQIGDAVGTYADGQRARPQTAEFDDGGL